MGTKYSSQSISGYNATPPADDGTVSEANKVKWSTIKEKLPDPIKTLTEAVNAALVTHFDSGPTAVTTNTTLGATHYGQIVETLGSGITLTLSDAATLTAGWYCDIVNKDSTNSITLARATAADLLNQTTANLTVLPLQALRVFVNAAATGFFTPGLQSFSQKRAFWQQGADIASATALTPGNDGNYFHVTGTTTITSIATAPAGTVYRFVFDGALTLTHNATTLILIGAANITTVAGDTGEFVSEGSGNYRMTAYHRKSDKLRNVEISIYTGSGTYSTPTGATLLFGLIQGGGAGGRPGASSGDQGGGPGGGAGALKIFRIDAPSGDYTVTIGGGGAASTNGDATSFGTFSAPGGLAGAAASTTGAQVAGGLSGNEAAAAGSGSSTTADGGPGIRWLGDGGKGGYGGGAGAGRAGGGGGGGSSAFGPGGAGGSYANGAGTAPAATCFGAGGGGGAATGGAGAAGLAGIAIVVTYY